MFLTIFEPSLTFWDLALPTCLLAAGFFGCVSLSLLPVLGSVTEVSKAMASPFPKPGFAQCFHMAADWLTGPSLGDSTKKNNKTKQPLE